MCGAGAIPFDSSSRRTSPVALRALFWFGRLSLDSQGAFGGGGRPGLARTRGLVRPDGGCAVPGPLLLGGCRLAGRALSGAMVSGFSLFFLSVSLIIVLHVLLYVYGG